AEIILAIPKILVALLVLAIVPPSLPILIVISGVVYSANVFRVARALGLNVITQDFVVVARLRGEGLRWILFGEVLPNIIRPLAVDFAIRIGYVMLFVSNLSFLG